MTVSLRTITVCASLCVLGRAIPTPDACECPLDKNHAQGVLIHTWPEFQCAYPNGACTWDETVGQGESAGSTKSVPSRYRVSAEAPAEPISADASRRALPERTLEHTAPRVASSRAELLAPLATFYRELCIYMIY